MLKALIMAGGAGTRLWPVSRQASPKYLLKLLGKRPLIAETVARAAAGLAMSDIYVITPMERVKDIREAVPELPAENILAEPEGRDSAACIGYGAARLAKADPGAVMLVMPVDHVIEPVGRFWETVHAGLPIAEKPGNLVTFGIKPTYPSTELGYLQRGEKAAQHGDISIFKLKHFREKPDEETAEGFLVEGDTYWNSGMFLWRAKTILDEMHVHLKGHARLLDEIAGALGTEREEQVVRECYGRFERISIDYGVMEKARNVFVVEADYQWDDVGTWAAVAHHHPEDPAGNTVLGTHVGIDTDHSIIVGEKEHLIATLGVDDLIIVHTPDATLVAHRDRAGDVKKVVAELARLGKKELL